jgi:hypothetical protein
MDPRLLALPQVQGDLNRVNIDPRARDALFARYGPGAAAQAAPDTTERTAA